MARSIVEDLDLGFVKQNPWVLRDQKLKHDALARAELERQEALAKEKSERGIEELEYGPGYVKKIRERFSALTSQSLPATPLPSANSSLARTRKRVTEESRELESKTVTSHESKEEAKNDPHPSSSSESQQSEAEVASSTNSDHQGGQDQNRTETEQKTDPEESVNPPSPPPLSMAALVLQQVEIIGRELRKTSMTLIERPDEDILGPTTVKSMKERFESGPNVKTIDTIASQTRRDQKDDVITGVKCLTLSLEQGGLEDEFPFEFPVAEGLSYPPPTPFPLDSEVMDFESSIRSPRQPSSAESTQTGSTGNLFSEKGSWTIDFEATIRPKPAMVSETPLRPPDYWIKTPRRIPSPAKPSTDQVDCSGFMQMKSMLSKFERNRAKSPDREQQVPKYQGDQVEILPNDPGPSVTPKRIQENLALDDDSFDILTDEEEEREEVLKVQLARADRLRPVKKRRASIEIIGGGVVPTKTSLSQGPKFQRKEIEFSQQPPKAYAYLEESFADEWVPGKELSLEQYRKIRDEAKIDRYKKFFGSTPYYPDYEEDQPTLEETVVTPLNHDGYYPPVTVDDVYVIKLRAPEPPSRPPPPLPPQSFEPDWYLPPPAYQYPSPPYIPLTNLAISEH